jgi:hypothetical protein
MQDIEPYFKWRDDYTAEEDRHSPFFGRTYSEFEYSHQVYNYYIHPQWDEFGSSTLYTKILFANYDDGYAMLEFIGEWNDCLYNDIMLLKDGVINTLISHGISKFILFCDNVLNFHGSDDCYYEEWYEDIIEDDGWIVMINTFDHVAQDLKRTRLQNFINFGMNYNDIYWQNNRPETVFDEVKNRIIGSAKQLW